MSSEHGLAALTLALRERLTREDEDVRASAAWVRAAARLPRDAAADACLAGAMSAASLEHPETLAPQNDEDRVVYVGWKSQAALDNALRENDEWTRAGPSGLATVGRTTRYGHSGSDLGLQFDRRVPVGDFVAPTADSYPRRSNGAPTVVQPASALAGVAQLHGLVDGIVLGERRAAWMRSEASS